MSHFIWPVLLYAFQQNRTVLIFSSSFTFGGRPSTPRRQPVVSASVGDGGGERAPPLPPSPAASPSYGREYLFLPRGGHTSAASSDCDGLWVAGSGSAASGNTSKGSHWKRNAGCLLVPLSHQIKCRFLQNNAKWQVSFGKKNVRVLFFKNKS